jgi:hypothetical protein
MSPGFARKTVVDFCCTCYEILYVVFRLPAQHIADSDGMINNHKTDKSSWYTVLLFCKGTVL